MTMLRLVPALLATTVLATPVLANGTVPVAPAPAPVYTPAPVADWAGFYGGLTLGFGTGTYGNDDLFPGDGEGDLDGATYGGVVGYYFQNGSWVFGPELALMGTSLSGSEACSNPAFTCDVDFNYIAALRGNLGYLVSPEMMVYGTLGLTTANVDVTTDNGAGPFGTDNDVNGYQFGLGVEWAASQTVHVRASVNRYVFNDDDFQTDVLYQGVGMDATVFELGVLFRF
ncbi:outer membrane protein [Roseicyclus persicicus]|uniref:Outer membrane beta-barrel protein n=1 Tax=Roseicyclus persicicus TaxID=2650661 RepID=A0A7X6H1M6_9RHOB|nr:outer membrane beta-barrel protein [Roseibacterium persicicum]NKX46411.1 outer membrane beta-barrel protein [Roseibacterium persicicum]